MQELATDTVVRPMPGDLLDVGADLLTQIGDFVDEGDLGREKLWRHI